MPPFNDPGAVYDKAVFIRFVEALIDDRQHAEEVEQANPGKYSMGGANGWQSGSISSFLDAAVAGALHRRIGVRIWMVRAGVISRSFPPCLGKIYAVNRERWLFSEECLKRADGR